MRTRTCGTCWPRHPACPHPVSHLLAGHISGEVLASQIHPRTRRNPSRELKEKSSDLIHPRIPAAPSPYREHLASSVLTAVGRSLLSPWGEAGRNAFISTAPVGPSKETMWFCKMFACNRERVRHRLWGGERFMAAARGGCELTGGTQSSFPSSALTPGTSPSFGSPL